MSSDETELVTIDLRHERILVPAQELDRLKRRFRAVSVITSMPVEGLDMPERLRAAVDALPDTELLYRQCAELSAVVATELRRLAVIPSP